jgi:outer membrane protein TolC
MAWLIMSERILFWRRCWRLLVVGATSAMAAVPLQAAVVAEDVFPELKEVLREALTQSPRMIASNLNRLKIEQLMLVSSAGLYPSVGGSLTFNQQLEQRDNGGPGQKEWDPGHRFLYNLSANYALFNWGSVRANAEIGRISAAIAANSVTEAYRLLAQQIRSEYLQLIIAKAGLRAAQYRMDMQREEFELIKTRVETGELARNSLSGAQMAFDDLLLRTDRTVLGFEIALKRFRRLIGNPSFGAEAIPDELPPVTQNDVSASVKPFHDQFLETEKWKAQVQYENQLKAIEQQKLREHVLRVNQRPKISLSAGVSQDELARQVDITERSRLTALFVGMNVSWNIFDGFSTRGQLLSTRTTLRQLENSLADAAEDMKEAALIALKEVDFAGRALDLAERDYQSSLASLAYAKENLELGLASDVAVKQAQASEYAARGSIFSRRAAYLNAIAAFLSSVNADPIVASGVNRPDGS